MATVIATAGLALLGTGVLAQKISYDYDRTVNFKAFKTYTWTKGIPVADELNHKRVVHAIDRQLVAKGLAQIDATGHPDVLVAYRATFDKNLQVNGSGTGWGPVGRSMRANVEEVVVGRLVVDITDAKTNSVVWSGRAADDINVNANPDAREKAINKTAGKLFKHYPPVK